MDSVDTVRRFRRWRGHCVNCVRRHETDRTQARFEKVRWQTRVAPTLRQEGASSNSESLQGDSSRLQLSVGSSTYLMTHLIRNCGDYASLQFDSGKRFRLSARAGLIPIMVKGSTRLECALARLDSL
jgi:hypothetical protein